MSFPFDLYDEFKSLIGRPDADGIAVGTAFHGLAPHLGEDPIYGSDAIYSYAGFLRDHDDLQGARNVFEIGLDQTKNSVLLTEVLDLDIELKQMARARETLQRIVRTMNERGLPEVSDRAMIKLEDHLRMHGRTTDAYNLRVQYSGWVRDAERSLNASAGEVAAPRTASMEPGARKLVSKAELRRSVVVPRAAKAQREPVDAQLDALFGEPVLEKFRNGFRALFKPLAGGGIAEESHALTIAFGKRLRESGQYQKAATIYTIAMGLGDVDCLQNAIDTFVEAGEAFRVFDVLEFAPAENQPQIIRGLASTLEESGNSNDAYDILCLAHDRISPEFARDAVELALKSDDPRRLNEALDSLDASPELFTPAERLQVLSESITSQRARDREQAGRSRPATVPEPSLEFRISIVEDQLVNGEIGETLKAVRGVWRNDTERTESFRLTQKVGQHYEAVGELGAALLVYQTAAQELSPRFLTDVIRAAVEFGEEFTVNKAYLDAMKLSRVTLDDKRRNVITRAYARFHQDHDRPERALEAYAAAVQQGANEFYLESIRLLAKMGDGPRFKKMVDKALNDKDLPDRVREEVINLRHKRRHLLADQPPVTEPDVAPRTSPGKAGLRPKEDLMQKRIKQTNLDDVGSELQPPRLGKLERLKNVTAAVGDMLDGDGRNDLRKGLPHVIKAACGEISEEDRSPWDKWKPNDVFPPVPPEYADLPDADVQQKPQRPFGEIDF